MTKFETFKGKNNELYFRLVNEKGELIMSSEGYTQKENLLNGIESVKKNIADPNRFEMKTSNDGKHYFNLKASNGQVIGSSIFWNSPEIRNMWINTLKTEVPKAEIKILEN